MSAARQAARAGAVAAACCWASLAVAEPARVLLAIANNVGDPEDAPLRFAGEDAQRILSLFVDIGGVSADRAYLVLDQPAPVVREKLAEVAGRIAELAAAGRDVVLIVYVSAHAKGGVLHLSGTHLSLSALRDGAAVTRARVRLLIIDACDSGAIARSKGGVLAPEYQVAMEQLPLAGQILISSSGPTEVAQEWDALSGSLFTHHLLTGLRGDADADGNGVVTLSEAYSYAYRRTVVQSEGSAQHPGFDFDVEGSGELVLSQPISAKSALAFPAALSGHFVIASQPRPDVVVEVDKEPGKVLRLAVPPGRYLLRRRVGRRIGFANLELPYGGQKIIDEGQMVWRDYVEVTAKGSDVDPHPASVLAIGSLGTSPLEETGARWRVGLSYRLTHGALWGLGSISVGTDRYRGVSLTTTEKSGSASVSAGYRWLALPVVPLLGLSVDFLLLSQSYVRDDEQAIERVFHQGPLPTRTTPGVAVGPIAGAELPIAGGLFALLYVKTPLRYLPSQGQSSLTVGLEGYAGLGWRL